MPRTKQSKPKPKPKPKPKNPRRFKGAALLLHNAGHTQEASTLHRFMGMK